MFIRKKKISNKTYYYLVENKREGKKVVQKVRAYLGTSEDILKKIGGLHETKE